MDSPFTPEQEARIREIAHNTFTGPITVTAHVERADDPDKVAAVLARAFAGRRRQGWPAESSTWDVRSVLGGDPLDELLRDGWEPFAVTVEEASRPEGAAAQWATQARVFHLRRRA